MTTAELTYYYVCKVARAKSFNLQSISINKFITNINKKKFIKDLDKSLYDFNNIYLPYIARDINFKNDSMVTRKSLLISPAHYFYYTKLVFDLVLEGFEGTEWHYKHYEEIEAYYSGILYKSTKHIKNTKQILFDNSYNQFQENLLNYEGRQGFQLDLSNFFDTINVQDLLQKLNTKYNENHLKQLKKFFNYFNINTLPQFHYSIASSILSQEYLINFDNEVINLLRDNRFKLIRFVDDMYFFNLGFPLKEGVFHSILDRINKILWENKLNINSKKIVLYIDEPFDRKISEDLTKYNDYKFKTEKRIEEKSNSLINNTFITFIKEVNTLYLNKGYNVSEFSDLFLKTFAVDSDNDSRKVINNFVFSNKWQDLEIIDLEYIISNYQFVFFLPDIFLILYLKVYDYIERKQGRDEITIRKMLREMDSNNRDSLRYLYSSLQYLIQRNFKRDIFIKTITESDGSLGKFINNYIV